MDVEEESVSGPIWTAKAYFQYIFLLYHPTAGTKLRRERLSPGCTRRAARGEGVLRNENSWVHRLLGACSMLLWRPVCGVACVAAHIFTAHMPFSSFLQSSVLVAPHNGDQQ